MLINNTAWNTDKIFFLTEVVFYAIIGSPLGGFLSDVWMKKRENARLLFPAVSSILTGILLFIAFGFLQGNLQYFVLFLIGMTALAFVPSGVVVTQDVVHPGLRAISLSLNDLFYQLLFTLRTTLTTLFSFHNYQCHIIFRYFASGIIFNTFHNII
ncbi:MAG: hypothetical protein K8S13_17540 [Desulfobacula sp.]|uniref:hypothetical protein n=1 Tax=Desulfobacula sp. TaxID=2593537 RepID=UPI0025B95041|nr:hypothetical protein [Desulfobacula sp.]MCD4721644.1 hypothetical protein [Desulfobacula sp.]